MAGGAWFFLWFRLYSHIPRRMPKITATPPIAPPTMAPMGVLDFVSADFPLDVSPLAEDPVLLGVGAVYLPLPVLVPPVFVAPFGSFEYGVVTANSLVKFKFFKADCKLT